MRHKIYGRKLKRDKGKRKALFKSLLNSLIKHGKIKTTLAKAKAIRGLADRLVTLAKEETYTSNQQIMSFLNRKESLEKLKKVVAPKFKNKIGGYIRMIKLGKRKGDHAEEVIIQWSVDEEEEKKQKSISAKPKSKIKKEKKEKKEENQKK